MALIHERNEQLAAAEREIERLRLEFYHYENENTYKGNSIRHWYDKAMAYGKSLDEANSEIERLRTALDRIKVRAYELGAIELHDMAWEALKDE